MRSRNEFLDSFVINFIENHFDEIDLDECGIDTTKEQLIQDVKNTDYTTSWIITEVMDWGTKTNYLKQYKVYDDMDENKFIIKVDERYFMYIHETDSFNECAPKKVIKQTFELM